MRGVNKIVLCGMHITIHACFFIIYRPGARGFGEVLPEVKYHFGLYFTESPQRRVYK